MLFTISLLGCSGYSTVGMLLCVASARERFNSRARLSDQIANAIWEIERRPTTMFRCYCNINVGRQFELECRSRTKGLMMPRSLALWVRGVCAPWARAKVSNLFATDFYHLLGSATSVGAVESNIVEQLVVNGSRKYFQFSSEVSLEHCKAQNKKIIRTFDNRTGVAYRPNRRWSITWARAYNRLVNTFKWQASIGLNNKQSTNQSGYISNYIQTFSNISVGSDVKNAVRREIESARLGVLMRVKSKESVMESVSKSNQESLWFNRWIDVLSMAGR